MKKAILIFILLIAALAGYWTWQAYNKPVATLHNVNPELDMDADKLFADYAENEESANQKYLGKIIRISGKVLDVNINSNEYSTIYLDGNDVMGSVSCQLEKGEEAKAEKLNAGMAVSIKGKCTGFAMDVVLTQCIIIEP
ncbi:MAG: hypothetical protein JNL47_10890 [Bacteroidia bacterium]|nr:hypothetical protein [Bacteroidia bacterium]